MDEAAVEAQGAKPLAPEPARIAAINDVGGVQAEVARFHAHRIPALFGFGAAQDYKDSRSIIAQAVQGGLGLPDRDYYTRDDERSRKIREEYVAHISAASACPKSPRSTSAGPPASRRLTSS